jgi:nucleoside-diphosphate-sugar epimerase
MRVLIVGCGYVGLPLGAELARQEHEVFGLRRSTSAAGQVKSAGIHPLIGDVARLEDLTSLPGPFDWVVNCVASRGGGPADYRKVYLRGTQNLIEWLAPTPVKKFVYTSSTSVYGQNDDSLVDESSPAEPSSETAQILVETEKALLQAASQRKFPAVILRLAGIYGPERGYWLKQYLRNEARLEGQGRRILNMIHRDDVAGSIIAALKDGKPGEIYNIVDDEPVTQLGFFTWLAGRLGKSLPPTALEVSNARKRGVRNKRVSNLKLKTELGYRFKCPSFREGCALELQRLVEAGELAFSRRIIEPDSAAG